MSSLDEVVFRESLIDDRYESIAAKREILWTNDSSGPTYTNGQVVFDCSYITNSGNYIDWSNAWIEVPYQVILTSSGAVSQYVAALKNGYYQIINSLSVELDGKGVVQQTPLSNFFINYKVLSTWSQEELAKYGGILGVAPDGCAFTRGGASGTTVIQGIQNNTIFNNAIMTTGYALANVNSRNNSPDMINSGYLERLQNQTYDYTTAGAYGTTLGVQSQSTLRAIGKPHVTISGSVVTLNLLCTIRLKDVHQFFDAMPLNKSNMRLIINTNGLPNSTNIFTVGAAAGQIDTYSVNPTTGGSLPVMLSSTNAGNPLATLTAAAAIAFRCGINIDSSTSLQTVCRLYAPSYKLNPSYELKMLDEMPIKTVRYNDLLNYNIQNVGGISAGAQLSQNLFSLVSNPQYLVLIPMFTDVGAVVASPALGASLGVKPYNSPFTSEPGTTSPFAALTNIQVFIGGQALYPNPLQYDYENYMEEVSQLNALNGGVVSQLTSGLITNKMWSSGYRYYVFDLRRGSPDSLRAGKSISIQFTNNCQTAIDLFCFCTYQREISVRTEDGMVTLL